MTRPVRTILVASTSALLTVVAYLGWLGWHADQHRVSGTSRIEGPYEPWQVIGLVITLAAIVAVAEWFERGMPAVYTVTGVVTALWAVDAASQQTDDASFWPIGMVLVLAGAVLGLSLVALVVRALRSAKARGRLPG